MLECAPTATSQLCYLSTRRDCALTRKSGSPRKLSCPRPRRLSESGASRAVRGEADVCTDLRTFAMHVRASAPPHLPTAHHCTHEQMCAREGRH